MFKCRRKYCNVLAILMMAAIPVWAGSGYLALVGPVPLRFRPPPETNTVVETLPVTLPEPVPVVEPVVAPKPEPATNSTPVVPPDQETTSAHSVPAYSGGSSTPEPIVSPQMLLRYFNRSTNGTTAGVVAPIDFTPPRATETPPPSSKATYSTTP